MRRYLLLFLVITSFFSSSTYSKTLTVFVTNFASFSSQKSNEIHKLFSEQLTKTDIFAVVNAVDASIVLLKDKSSLSNTQLEQVKQAFNHIANTTQGAKTVNLTSSLYVVTDILRPLPSDYTQIEIFLIDSLYHKDIDFDFSLGYPNDGFLSLRDNDFSYLPPIGNKQIKLHVFTTSTPTYSTEYQRFFTHLAKKLFNATLVSFNDKLTLNSISPLDSEQIKSVAKSEVLQSDKKPLCAFDDTVDYNENMDLSVILTLKNPCRTNSSISFYHNGILFTTHANSQGEATLNINLQAGTNKVELLKIDNTHRTVYEKNLSERDDQMTITVKNDVAHIIGYNPLRKEGQKVSVTHPESGRVWDIRVQANHNYELDIPVTRGQHYFNVSRVTGINPQSIEVINGANCLDNVDYQVKQATATVIITNPCRTGKSITFTYLDQKIVKNFEDGKAIANISLYKEYNDILFTTERGNERHIEIKVTDINQLIKVTLIWNLPVDMDLHIYEPDFEIGRGYGHIFFGQKNAEGYSGKGYLDIDNRGTDAGSTHVENYVVNASSLNHGVIRVRLHYYSRHHSPSGKYCDGGEYAQVPVKLIIFNKGSFKESNITIPSAACNIDLSPDIESYLAEEIRLP